jgi:hypothetical protein
MPYTQVTLVANTVATVTLDAPTGRIVLTQESGTPATVYGTTDGTLPSFPTNDAEIPDQYQFMLSAFVSDRVVVAPHLYGDHMVIPTVQLLSAGTPTISVQW